MSIVAQVAHGGLSTLLHSGASPSDGDSLGLPVCPSSAGGSVVHPSTTALSIVIAVVAVALGTLTILRYNFLLLYEGDRSPPSRSSCMIDEARRTAVHTPLTSNTYWIIYFFQVGLKYMLDSLMYGEKHVNSDDTALAYTHFSDLVMHSLTGLSLTLALLYQFKHRSGHPERTSDDGSDSSDSPARSFTRRIASAEAGLLILAGVHIATAWWAVPHLPAKGAYSNAYWVFVSAVMLQRLPLFIIGTLLAFPEGCSKSTTDSVNPNIFPSATARCLLGLGLLFDLPHMLPLTTWTKHILSSISSHPCPLYIFSVYDVILIMYLAALLLFFGFLRLEFLRVKEQELYICHIEYQERLDARRTI